MKLTKEYVYILLLLLLFTIISVITFYYLHFPSSFCGGLELSNNLR